MMTTTFQNLTVHVPGEPKEAYAKLCEALAAIGGDWVSDTYSTSDDYGDETVPSSTEELFGD